LTWKNGDVNGMSDTERMEFIELSDLSSSRATTARETEEKYKGKDTKAEVLDESI
jgi:hypothetical protein